MADQTPHRLPARIATGSAVAVIGLGRFGGATATSLVSQGVEVLGIDSEMRIVEQFADRLTLAVQADSTNTDALRQLAIPDFGTVVLGIGANLEASILTASHLMEFGIPTIWAKAMTDDHARILRQLGIANVLQPEAEMGRRLAATLIDPDHAAPLGN